MLLTKILEKILKNPRSARTFAFLKTLEFRKVKCIKHNLRQNTPKIKKKE